MNLFSAITSGIGAYNTFNQINKPTQPTTPEVSGEGMLGPINTPDTRTTLQKVAPGVSNTIGQLGDAFNTSKVGQAVKKAQPIVQDIGKKLAPVGDALYAPVKPVVDEYQYGNKVNEVRKPYQEQLSKLGITAQHLDDMGLSDEEKQQVKDLYSQVGVEIPGLAEQQAQQPVQPESLTDQFKMKSSENFGVSEGIKDIGKFFVNLPADTAQVVGGLYDAVRHPIDTTTGLLKVGQGLSDKAVFGLGNSILTSLGYTPVNPTVDAQMVDAIGTHIKDTYGTPGKFKKAIVENPADTLLTLMGGLGLVSKVAEANNMTNVVSNINKLQETINPVNLVTKPITTTGKILKGGGEMLYKTAIKPNVSEAEQLLKYKAGLGPKPITVADTALKTGIKGTETRIGVQGLREADRIFKEKVNPIFDKSTTEHSLTDLFKKAQSKIDSMKEGELRKSELKEGLSALQEDYSNIGKDKFTTKTLNEEKSSLDKFTPDKVFKGKPIASSYNEAKNILANVFRDAVHTDLGKHGLKSQEAFRDYANLKELSKVGVKGLTEGGLKGGFGGFWTTMYDQIATPIKTIGGQVLYRVGDKLEFVGPKGLNKLGDYLKGKVSIDKNGLINNNLKYAIPYLSNTPKDSTRNDKPVLKPKKITN